VLLPPIDSTVIGDLYARLDGFLLAGGGDVAPHRYGQTRLAGVSGVDAPRDRLEIWLVRRAVDDGMPLLAICRGIQVLNVALGGSLYQDIPQQLPGAANHNFRRGHPRNHLGHRVDVVSGTRLAQTVGDTGLGVNSFHHQGLYELAPALAVSATSPDGLIEAVEIPGHDCQLGVQWHPEELIEDDERMLRLFQALVAAAADHSP